MAINFDFKFGFYVPWNGPPVANPTEMPPDAGLMHACLRLIEPRPDKSCAFVPGGAVRAGYKMNDRKQPVRFWREKRRVYGFHDNGRDFVYLPNTPELIKGNYFIQGGCYLGVHLLDDEEKTKTLFIDLDKKQVDAGALPRVLWVLDAANIAYFLERSTSGQGIHIWIVFPTRVLASKASRWLASVLGAAGLKKKDDHDPGDYDEIKPTGGDGGVVIPPHFFRDGRSCIVSLDPQNKITTLDPAEAQVLLDNFQQNPQVVEQIEAQPDESVVEGERRKRGRPQRRVIEKLDEGVLQEIGLRPLTPDELQDDMGRLRFAVSRDKKLRDWARGGSAPQRGGRSEKCFGLIQALLRMDIHPCTIEEYIRSWPRYSSGTSSATEVLEIIRQTGIKELLRRTSPWRKIIRSGTEVYRDMQTQEQGQVRRLLLACNEQLLRLLEGPGAVNDDSEQRQPLIVIDAPPGSGKTTVAIPEALLRLRYAVRDCPWPLATLYRERRENVVESEEWLNMLDEEDLKSA